MPGVGNGRTTKPPRDLPELETERLLLRKMRLADAPAVFAYASDPDISRYVSWETHRTVRDSEDFLRHVTGGYERGDLLAWGLVLKEDGAFVGTCGLDAGYEPEHARAEMGYALSREHWGRGLMPEAVRTVLAFGFGSLGLNRVQARCAAENLASARVMEKVGMTYEGTLRESEYLNGAYTDMRLYSILRREFPPPPRHR